ncbi:MAG: BlaI/MecI/CopY family transcriptional regulator [candidate division Zixibacteria bacterium]|nr:BlaI/MecI/CopY family transcriptional regulator [candidate division Zixibacteria bacterium]
MKHDEQPMTRRERQIMDVIYKLGEATAAEVREHLAEPPSYSTVRKLLSILEEKGAVKHIERDRRYVFLPARSKRVARRTALKHLVETFFENSTEGVVAALMDMSASRMSEEEFKRLAALIDQKRKERGDK